MKKIFLILMVWLFSSVIIGCAELGSIDAANRDVKIGFTGSDNIDRVTTNIILMDTVAGYADSTVTWNSSDENVIAITGEVTRPTSNDVKVTMSYVLSFREETRDGNFVLTVIKENGVEPDSIDEVKKGISIVFKGSDNINNVTEDIILMDTVAGYADSTVTWNSSNENVIAVTGEVTRPTTSDVKVTMSYVLEFNGETREDNFVLTVIKKSSDYAQSIDFYYINDLHGGFDKDSQQLGISYIANYFRNTKEANPDSSLFVAGGDMFQGTALSNYQNGYYAQWILNELNFDCMVIGNHEFDWGIDEILKYHDGNPENGEANYPLLGANIFDKATNSLLPNVKPYIIIERGGYKIGIIGTIGYGLESSIAYTKIKDYYFSRPQDAVKEYAPILRQKGCDLVVSLSHDAGEYTNSVIGNFTGNQKVDLIFNAHDHWIKNENINGIPVIESGSSGRAIGHVGFEFDDNKKPVAMVNTNITSHTLLGVADTIVENKLNNLKAILDPTHSPTLLTSSSSYDKNELTAWMGKLMAAYTGAAIGVHNTGGTRTSISRNQVINGYLIFEIFPFDNIIIKAEIKGKYIKEYLNSSSSAVRYYYNGNISMLADETYYTFATNDYIYYGSYADELRLNARNEVIYDNIYIRDIMMAEFNLQKVYGTTFSTSNPIRTTPTS